MPHPDYYCFDPFTSTLTRTRDFNYDGGTGRFAGATGNLMWHVVMGETGTLPLLLAGLSNSPYLASGIWESQDASGPVLAGPVGCNVSLSVGWRLQLR